MPQAKSKSTKLDCWAEIDRLVKTPQVRTPRGDEWRTLEQLGKQWGKTPAGAKAKLTELKKAGMLETFRGGQVNPDGKCAPQYWYRPKA